MDITKFVIPKYLDAPERLFIFTYDEVLSSFMVGNNRIIIPRLGVGKNSQDVLLKDTHMYICLPKYPLKVQIGYFYHP